MYFVLRLELKRIRFRNFRARCSLLFLARKKERVLAKTNQNWVKQKRFSASSDFYGFVCSVGRRKKSSLFERNFFLPTSLLPSLLLQQARDLNINESTRGDGASRFALQKLSTEQTAARAKEATARLSGEVSEYVNKKYWTQAGNALRRAVYTLRFDVNNLVAEKGGDADAAKDLFKTIESLDFAIRSKDLDTASPLAAAAASKADAILAAF